MVIHELMKATRAAGPLGGRRGHTADRCVGDLSNGGHGVIDRPPRVTRALVLLGEVGQSGHLAVGVAAAGTWVRYGRVLVVWYLVGSGRPRLDAVRIARDVLEGVGPAPVLAGTLGAVPGSEAIGRRRRQGGRETETTPSTVAETPSVVMTAATVLMTRRTVPTLL